MSEKKLPSEITTDKLLEDLATAGESKTLSNEENDIIEFLTKNDISNGKMKIKKRLLYRLYRKFSLTPVQYNVFCANVREYLRNDSTNMYFLVNKEIFFLTKNVTEKIKKQKLQKTSKGIDEFRRFLIARNIKAGTYRYLEPIIIYYLYNVWAKENGTLRIARHIITRLSKLFLTTKRVGLNKFVFGISEEAKDMLTDDLYKKAHEGGKYFHKNALPWKKKQTETDKIPGSEEEPES